MASPAPCSLPEIPLSLPLRSINSLKIALFGTSGGTSRAALSSRIVTGRQMFRAIFLPIKSLPANLYEGAVMAKRKVQILDLAMAAAAAGSAALATGAMPIDLFTDIVWGNPLD